MKTNTNKTQKTRTQNRTEQGGGDRAPIDFVKRSANRALNTDKLLALLEREAPRFFELAEVVGKWVWIQFDGKQPSEITRVLAELGFHWNNARQIWQHPCGTIPTQRASVDPRQKYGSHFAADHKTA
jgi:hypothetical protein